MKIVKAKFEQNPELAQKLLAAGEQGLIEGNKWRDTYWDVNMKTGIGEDHLGKILMRVREELKPDALTV
ncbi:MAG: NADAR domain-containing protein [Candidatus Ornithomonoglobus sp.]